MTIAGHAQPGTQRFYHHDLSDVDLEGLVIDGKQGHIFFDQLLAPEQLDDVPGNLPLKRQREIDAEVSMIEGAPERYRRRKQLQTASMNEFISSGEWVSQCQSGQSESLSPQLPNSVERMGDLRQSQTIDRILTERYYPHSSVVLDALEIPDFNMRTNGLQALKAMILFTKAAGRSQRLYYPNESPIQQGNELICPRCRTDLNG